MNSIQRFFYWCKIQWRDFNNPLAFCPNCKTLRSDQQLRYINDKPIESYCQNCKKWFPVKGNQLCDIFKELWK
jgi:hypothetical protein